jgi:hypothetical protein
MTATVARSPFVKKMMIQGKTRGWAGEQLLVFWTSADLEFIWYIQFIFLPLAHCVPYHYCSPESILPPWGPFYNVSIIQDMTALEPYDLQQCTVGPATQVGSVGLPRPRRYG